MKGRLTFLAEGNENPSSSNYSKKLRVDERRGLVIGRGYRLYEKTEHHIIQDMQALGVDTQLISAMRKMGKLRGEEAKKAVEKTNFCLTKEQELKLFEKEYETCLMAIQNFISNNMYAYGTLKFQKMPEYQQDILVDFFFAGDFDLKIQNLLLTSLGKTAKSASNEIFNELIRDIGLWKQLHVNPDRIKHRIIHVRESASAIKIVKEERNQLIYGVPQEVVSGLILKRPEEYIVIGYQIDYSTEELLFILKPSLNVVDRGKESYEGINFADLITCLDILYDDTVRNKCIGISHVVDPNNQEDQLFLLKSLKRVLYPDILENRSILKGTKIEQDLTKILDFIHGLAYGNTLLNFIETEERSRLNENYSLNDGINTESQDKKQVSVSVSGTQYDAIKKNETQKRSVRLISAMSKIKLTRSSSVQKQRNNDSVTVIKNLRSQSGKKLPISEVRTENSPSRVLDRTLYVGPRNAEVSWLNKLARLWINPKEISVLDYVIDNSNEYFSIKDVEMKLESKQMKKVKPSLIDDVPIDAADHPAIDMISQWPELSAKLIKQFPLLQRYKQIIKAWAFAERIYRKKVPIDFENLKLLTRRHKEGVAQKGYSGSPKRNVGGKISLDDGPKRSNQRIEAGLVGIMIGLDQELEYKSLPDFPTKRKKENERGQVAQNFFRDHHLEEKNRQKKEIVTLEKGTFKLKFPLLRKGSCSVCEKSLSFLEVCSAIGNKYLCSLHHPKSCQRCYRFPQGENVVRLGDHVYHMDCMVCQKCKKPLSIGNTFRTNEYFMHVKCPETQISSYKERSNSLEHPSSFKKNISGSGSIKNLKTLKFTLTKRT